MGVMSHELRTPLTAIKGNIQLVKRQLRSITKTRQSHPDKVGRVIETSEARIGRALQKTSEKAPSIHGGDESPFLVWGA